MLTKQKTTKNTQKHVKGAESDKNFQVHEFIVGRWCSMMKSNSNSVVPVWNKKECGTRWSLGQILGLQRYVHFVETLVCCS